MFFFFSEVPTIVLVLRDVRLAGFGTYDKEK